MDSDIRAILSQYSIDTLDILKQKGRANLLVADPQVLQNGKISANLLEVPWGGIEHLGVNQWLPEKFLDVTIHFDCDYFLGQQILQSTRVLLFDYELENEDVHTRTFDIKPTTKSFISTWYHGATAANWVFNLCCGGYGGWEYAFKTAYDNGWPFHYHIGIDHLLTAAAQHSINHRTTLIPNIQLGASFLVDRHKSSTICAPIQAQGWRQAVSAVNPQIWTISFPCQSWTGAAWSLGFLDDNGKVLLEALGLARVMRPMTILLENVKNFSQHPQYSDFCQVVHWCGYRFLHQAIVDAQERIPCVRPRWLAILERIEEKPQPFTWQKWETINHSLLTWGCHMKSTPEEISEFRIPSEVVQKYMDVSYLPLHAPYWAKNKILNYRAVPLQNKMPVVMAAYGRQHELRDDLLRSRGLFGHFTAEDCKFRWWKPVELIMAHMQNEPIALLRPKENAWQTIGNCIIQHHALITVYAALDHIYGPNKLSLDEMLVNLEAKRITPSNVKVHTDDFAWYVGADGQIEDIQKYVQILAKEMEWGSKTAVTWPSNCIFDFDLGCVSIDNHQSIEAYPHVSPTVPFSLTLPPVLDELPQEVNSPIHSPADQIADSLDCQIQQHVESMEDLNPQKISMQENDQEENKNSPVQHDDYQIVSDESMHSESDQEYDDIAFQACLQQHLVPSETKPADVSYMITPLLEPGNYSAICVLEDLPTKTLTQLWEHRVALINTDKYCQTGVFQESYCTPEETLRTSCLMPIDSNSQYHQKASNDNHTGKLLIFDIAGQTFAQEMNGCPTPELSRFPEHVKQQKWYDEIGLVPPKLQIDNMRVFSDPVETANCHDIHHIILAMANTSYECRIPNNSDVLVMQFRGNVDDLSQVLTFWQIAIDTQWISQHSRTLVRQIVDSTCVQLVFQPRGNTFATPIAVFRRALETRLLMTLLNSLGGSNDNCRMTFKIGERTLPSYSIDKALHWDTLLVAIKHIYTITEFGLQPSIVHLGKRLCAGCVADLGHQEEISAKFHIVPATDRRYGCKGRSQTSSSCRIVISFHGSWSQLQTSSGFHHINDSAIRLTKIDFIAFRRRCIQQRNYFSRSMQGNATSNCQ